MATTIVNTHKAIFYFLILACPILSTSQTCSESSCGLTQASIRFPFRLQRVQPLQCGFPGFDLICVSQSQTVLELPNSGKFSVQSINYATQEIWLNDPQNCLPQRLLMLNISGSPFRGAYDQQFTLFSCNTSFDYRQFRFNPVACLSGSNSNNAVVATADEKAFPILSNWCSLMTTISVPVGWPFFQQVWTSDLSEDIRLTWETPQCRSCESSGGICRRGTNSGNDDKIVCSSNQRGLSRGALVAIGIGVGIQGFLFIIGLVYFCCKRAGARGVTPQQTLHLTTAVAEAPQPIIVMGLDRPTIESYPKTVLGDSRRLPKPDENICAICLCEYKPKETLRTIPLCQHCFHADCIDEWLRSNATCPICRNPPPQSPRVQDS